MCARTKAEKFGFLEKDPRVIENDPTTMRHSVAARHAVEPFIIIARLPLCVLGASVMRKHSNYACSTACALTRGLMIRELMSRTERVANSTNDPTLYSLVLETAWCTPPRAHNFFNFTAVSRVFGILSLCSSPSCYLISCLRPSPIPPLISSPITAIALYKTFLETAFFLPPFVTFIEFFRQKRIIRKYFRNFYLKKLTFVII